MNHYAGRMTEKPLITLNRLHELLKYDSESGIFTWIDSRPLNRKTGTAGMVTPEGYASIKVDGRNYLSHRLAWFHFYGDWPKGQIDHINRNRSDNRIANLRDVTASENQQNTLLSPRNKSGFKGVSWNKNEQKWNAKIGHQSKKIHLGFFDDVKDAASAYVDAVAKYHSCNPVGGVN